MMKLKRIQDIANYIQAFEICPYEELCRQFDVSLTTMRRDVEELIRLGKVEKVYGGVKAIPQVEEEEPLTSFVQYSYAKDCMGKLASSLVEDNDIIVLGSGSTVAHMVRYLKEKKNLTVITNNLAVINEALRYHFNVVSIGGNLDRRTLSFVGTQTIKQVGELNAKKCFISCNGITEHGISNVTDLEADIKKAVMNISSKVILLADHEKFDVMSLYNFASLDQIDVLITDEKIAKEYTTLLQDAEVQVQIAK